MHKILLAIILVFIAALFGWVGFTFYKAYQPQAIILQGEIDVQSYHLGSKVAGRVGKIFVKKGDVVQKGEKVFTITSPEVEAKLEQAKAAQEAANAQKIQTQKGARKQEIKAAFDQWEKAKSAAALMKSTYNRIEKLYKDGVISRQKRDEVYTKYQVAKYDESAAKQVALMAKEGAREEVKKSASAQERVYKAKVQEVNTYIKETTQYAFHQGEVNQILLQSGELAPTGFPVVTLVDMHDAWARFAVREDYLSHFQLGKEFKVKIPALSNDSYTFKVTYIAIMGDYATWKATQSGKGFDMKSFEVELRPTQAIKNLRIGMSVLLEL